MTVRELRPMLYGPSDKLEVAVFYGSEEYDITDPTPVQDAFADYVVDGVTSTESFKYKIHLKQEYVKEVRA